MPIIKKREPTIHKLVKSGTNGTTKQNVIPITAVRVLLPKRTVSQPEKGIAIIAPAAEQSKSVPNIELETL